MGDNCEKVVELRYLYLDREMTWWRRARFSYHLRRCPPCGDVVEFEAKVKAVICRYATVDTASEGFQQRLRQAIRDCESHDQR